MKQSIGEHIKKIRNKHNMTLTYLEEKSGVSNSHLSRIERGLREPSPETLKKLSEPLGVSYEKLLNIAGYLDKNTETNKEKIKSALSNDPELLEFWDKLKEREDLQMMFKQTKDLDPAAIKQIIEIIKTFEKEEEERYNGG